MSGISPSLQYNLTIKFKRISLYSQQKSLGFLLIMGITWFCRRPQPKHSCGDMDRQAPRLWCHCQEQTKRSKSLQNLLLSMVSISYTHNIFQWRLLWRKSSSDNVNSVIYSDSHHVKPVWLWNSNRDNVINIQLEEFSTITIQSDSTGIWRAALKPVEAGGPYNLTASQSITNSSITLTDVLFGDTWLCSGQSNMAFTVGQVSQVKKC